MNLIKVIEEKLQSNDTDSARTFAKKIPDLATREAVLGSVELKAENLQQSFIHFERAERANPNHPLVFSNYVKLLLKEKKFRVCAPIARRAYESKPTEELYLLHHAACLAETDQFKDASELLAGHVQQQVGAGRKPSVAARTTLASLYRATLQPGLAIEQLKALKIDHPDANTDIALAEALAEFDPRAAVNAFRELQTDSSSTTFKWNRSFVELRAGNFDLGWDLYDTGLDDKVGKVGRPLPPQVKQLGVTTDFGEVLRADFQVFSAEQGLGDQVIFLSCFKEAMAQCRAPVLLTEDRTVSLYERAFPGVGVYQFSFGLNLANQRGRISKVFPIGSLPKVFRRTRESFQQSNSPFLSPDLNKVGKFRDLFKSKFSEPRVVGVSWSGGYWERQKDAKSFPFEAIEHLMPNERVRFVSLQYGDTSKAEAYAKEKNLPVTFFKGIDYKKDLDSWLALAYACDGIVSASTALVHFMGAMGRPVKLVMTDKVGPFIWGLEDGTSIIYPSVEVRRKPPEVNWSDFLKEVSR